MRGRGTALVLALVACGGRVGESAEPAAEVPPRATPAAADPSCVLQDDEVLGFAVDDAAIWRLQAECRTGKSGRVVVREDRTTHARTIAADRVWAAPPVVLAGDALVLADKDSLHRVDTDTGTIDDLPVRSQLLAGNGTSAFATVSAGTADARYAVMQVDRDGEPRVAGTVPATFQMQALAASPSGPLATMWSVCDGTSSCAGLFAIAPSGVTKLAAWPVTDLGVSLGPLVATSDRAVTLVGRDLVEAAGGAVRTLASLDAGESAAAIALGSGGRTFACLTHGDVARIVEAKDGGLAPLATGPCGALVWTAGELFWTQPESRDRYGTKIVVSTIARRRVD